MKLWSKHSVDMNQGSSLKRTAQPQCIWSTLLKCFFLRASSTVRSVCRKWKEMKEEAVIWNYLWPNLFSPSESVSTYLFKNYRACSSHLCLLPRTLEPDCDFSRQIIGLLGTSWKLLWLCLDKCLSMK